MSDFATLKAILLATIATATIIGCAALTGATAPYVVRAAERYCEESPSARALVADTVAGQLQGTGITIAVGCPAD